MKNKRQTDLCEKECATDKDMFAFIQLLELDKELSLLYE